MGPTLDPPSKTLSVSAGNHFYSMASFLLPLWLCPDNAGAVILQHTLLCNFSVVAPSLLAPRRTRRRAGLQHPKSAAAPETRPCCSSCPELCPRRPASSSLVPASLRCPMSPQAFLTPPPYPQCCCPLTLLTCLQGPHPPLTYSLPFTSGPFPAG